MTNKKIIPIFYATDDAFVKYTIVSIKSIIENASKDYYYHIYVLNTTISESMKEHLNKLKTPGFKIEFIDVSKYLDSISDKLPLRDYYSKTTYYRLFIAELFNGLEKAIYIDSDTVVLGDISELYNHDVSGYLVGACHEQVMRQIDVYGTYVEKVLGIDRYNYFNAGILLINCHEFRKQRVIYKFIDLLHEYNFVVTQDEDYLNIICKDKVLWLNQAWNTEMIGELLFPENKIKIIHYIMTSKPWHYHDCPLANYFWKYAKKTSVYNLVLNVVDNYSKEEKENDDLVCKNLLQLAIDETNRPDNYLKRKK